MGCSFAAPLTSKVHIISDSRAMNNGWDDFLDNKCGRELTMLAPLFGKPKRFEVAEMINYSIERISMLMKSSSGQLAFQKFLQDRRKAEYLSLFDAIEQLKHSKDKNNARFQDISSSIIESYLKPGSASEVTLSMNLKAKITTALSQSTDRSKEDDAKLLVSLQRIQQDILIVLAMRYFTQFAKSHYFREWKEGVYDHKDHRKDEKVRKSTYTADQYGASVDQELKDQSPDLDDSVSSILLPLTSKGEFSLTSIDKETLFAQSSTNSSWTTTLMAAVDSWPICVTMATARVDRWGFPLTFVNKKFCEVTQYEAHEVLGRNCAFLQKSDTIDSEQRQLLSNALREAKPIKVVLTNHHRDGTPFLNLLAVKPVFDQYNQYRFVVGVQFAVTEDTSHHFLRLAHTLIELLPSEVFCSDDE